MIPYFQVTAIATPWGQTIEPFGGLVVAGCLVGFLVVQLAGRVRQLNLAHLAKCFVWAITCGFLLSRWASLALYHPELPFSMADLLRVQDSMSSYGGFLGGSIGALGYLKRHNLPLLPYIDTLVLGLVHGWIFGRLGCALVHDHPGIQTDFFLAVAFPDGPRHDLGLYEFVFTILLAASLWGLRGRSSQPGRITALVCLAYPLVRFFLDYLRVGDRLYLGHTPAQYFSVIMFAGGLLLWHALGKRAQPRPESAPHQASS